MEPTFYKKLLENVSDAIIVIQDDEIKYVNCKLLQLLNYNADELVIKGLDQIIHLDDYEKILVNQERVVKGEKFEDVTEIKVIGKNKISIPVEIRIKAFELNGRPAAINFLADISDRKKIYEVLQESKNMYKTIYENAGTAIGIADQNRCIVMGNKKMEELTGFKQEELIGEKKKWDYFIAPSDIELVKRNHQEKLANPSAPPRQYECSIVTKNEDIKNVYITATLIPGTNKSLVSMVDITDRKKMEAALQKSNALVRELFRNSLDVIAVLDEKGIFQYCSPSLTAITGHQEHDLLGKNCFEFIFPNDQKMVMNDYSDLVAGKVDGFTTEFRFRKTDGSWIYFEALGNNCVNNPAINGIIINARDVTLRKRMEDHLLQAHKMQAIGTLAGGIAHDFNNLLMGIQGYISLILLYKDFDDPDFDKLNNIQSLVQSGADLAANLLSFARGGQYELESTDLNELVTKTCRVFGRTKKEIILNEKYEQNLFPVEVDRGRIEQVLINLYINAWQAMPSHGGDIYVETDSIILSEHEALIMDIKEGNYVRIMITDTGRGMDEDTCRRVFEPFFTTKEKDRGSGLAMASAYGIVREHGGTIDVTSKPGQGSAFTIYLPASTKEMARETNLSKKLLPGDETILLVDDETTIIDVCEEMLSTLGYNILTANNGRDALKIYEGNKGKIDLVILDMIMPGFSGSETFEQLRLIDPEVRVMLSTGYIISDQVKNLMAKGCRGFIQKPFHMEELSEKIREVLEKND